MPCKKCENGKYRLGSSDCKYSSKQSCQKAERAYYAKKNKKSSK